jgi:putative transposase
MAYNPNIHHRKSIRLKGYDYSQAGLYFITICTQNRACLFGEIVGASHVDGSPNEKGRAQDHAPTGFAATGIAATMVLNDAGIMVVNEWLKLPNRFPNIQLHEFVLMPNHFHAILEIVGATLEVAPNTTVAANNEKGRVQDHAPTDIASTGIAETGIATSGKTVGDMVGAFQSIVTVEYIRGVKTLGWQPFNGKLWQRNYWEHIIRNFDEYQRISEYIANNPQQWANDKLHL